MASLNLGISPLAAFVCGAAALAVCLACRGGEAQLQIGTAEPAVTVKDGDRLLLEYLFAKVPFKPYVRQVLSPGGVNVARDQVADHIHHHGLMYAIKVDGVNFWEETPACGKELHKGWAGVKTAAQDGASSATCTEQVEWAAADGKALMQETRQLTVYRAPDIPATLLTWKATLAPAEGKPEIKLGGNHYHGLGIRFLQCMDKGGEHFTPEGKVKGEVVRGNEQLTQASWCAYTAAVDGKPVTFAMFDHPGNPRKALWFSMTQPFAYLSATMNLHREPLPVKAGEPLTLRYGVALWDGKASAEEVGKLCQRWLELNRGN